MSFMIAASSVRIASKVTSALLVMALRTKVRSAIKLKSDLGSR